MPCLLALLAVLAPRVVSVVLWLFTTFFAAAFGARPLLLLLGVILMPFTTLTYAWAVNSQGGVHGTFFTLLMVIAVIADLGGLRSSYGYRRVYYVR